MVAMAEKCCKSLILKGNIVATPLPPREKVAMDGKKWQWGGLGRLDGRQFVTLLNLVGCFVEISYIMLDIYNIIDTLDIFNINNTLKD